MKFVNIIDIHASWLVINSVQGCVKGCRYCFLERNNLNKTNFIKLKEAEDAVEEL